MKTYYEKKFNTIMDRADKTMTIIEEDCKLSEDEKYQLLINLRDYIEKEETKLSQKSRLKDKLFELSTTYSSDDNFGALVGVTGIQLMMLSSALLGRSLAQAEYGETVLSSSTFLLGLIGAVNSFLNISYEKSNEPSFVVAKNIKRIQEEEKIFDFLETIKSVLTEQIENRDFEEKDI